MTDKEIYQQIEEYSEEAKAQYAKIHEQVEASIVKHAQAKKRRKKLFIGILPIAVVLVITLAIVLPIVLQPQDEEIRYSDLSVLGLDVLDCNLKEYYAKTNQELLYLDWYEFAEELYTARYYEEGKENDTVYLHETMTDGNTGYHIELSLMKRNIVVDNLETKVEEYQSTNIRDVQISYVITKTLTIAKFEYQGYKYYMEIKDSVTLDFLTGTIESMFNN